MLSDDAQFAALQWGIQDRSTTIRDTKYLIEALDVLSKNILEVYFNIKQLSIQETERKGRPYYAFLGEFGWETVTWKKPHETQKRISRGSGNKSISIVVWKKPTIQSRITKSKMAYLAERLHDLDLIMDHLQKEANDGVELPHFSIFHDIIAEIVRMSMASGDASNSHTLLSLNLDEHSESICKEVSKRILRMPRVEGLVVNKQNAKKTVLEIKKK